MFSLAKHREKKRRERSGGKRERGAHVMRTWCPEGTRRGGWANHPRPLGSLTPSLDFSSSLYIFDSNEKRKQLFDSWPLFSEGGNGHPQLISFLVRQKKRPLTIPQKGINYTKQRTTCLWIASTTFVLRVVKRWTSSDGRKDKSQGKSSLSRYFSLIWVLGGLGPVCVLHRSDQIASRQPRAKNGRKMGPCAFLWS